MIGERRDWTDDFRQSAGLIALVWIFGHSLDLLFMIAAGLPALTVLRTDLPLIVAQYILSLMLFPIVRSTERMPLVQRGGIIVIAVAVIAGLMVASVLIGLIAQGRLPAQTVINTQKLRAWLGRSMFMPIYIYITGFIATILIFAQRNRQMADQQSRLLAAEAAAAHARLLALRLQVNPHFLFNALNAISSLIVSRRVDEAETAVDRLSEFLRASLAADPTALVALEEELAATEAYLQIEAVRFPDRLVVDIDSPDELLAIDVPSLILQPLVENAVKYGVGSSSGQTRILVKVRQRHGSLSLTVEDDSAGDPAAPPASGTGIGLANVRQRLALLYGDAGSLVIEQLAPGFRATILIPVDAAKGELSCR